MQLPLCACGCGRPVSLAKQTAFARGSIKGQPNRYIRFHRHTGPLKRIKVQGYFYVSIGGNKRRREHILIAERAMGRPLPAGAHVHHVNGDGLDNRNENLVVCQDAAYHRLLHVRQRALEETGDANKMKCRWCGRYDDRSNLTVLRGHALAQHKACHTERERARREKVQHTQHVERAA